MDATNTEHQSHVVIWLGSKKQFPQLGQEKQSQALLSNYCNHITCPQGGISKSVLDSPMHDGLNGFANDSDLPEKEQAAITECENIHAETQAADLLLWPTTTTLDESHHLYEDDSPAAQPSYQRFTSTTPAPALPSPTSAQIQLSRSPMRQQPLHAAKEPAELHQTGVMDATEIQSLARG